jgi:hypothetical protein
MYKFEIVSLLYKKEITINPEIRIRKDWGIMKVPD